MKTANSARPCALQNPKRHDDLLNYQLKRLVTFGGAPAIRLCEGRYGVTRSEWRLTAALVENGPMAPSLLAHTAQMELPRVSRILTSLMAKGLVHRSDEEGDRRKAIVVATAAGRRLYAELFPQICRINRRIMEVLDTSEARVLEECLRKLTARALDIYREGGGVDVRADRRKGGSRRFWS